MIGTYRLQLHRGFGFDDAVAVLDVLQDLGVDHVYTSPTLAAVPGSTHGYDVVDHGRINPELGGEGGHARLSAALAARSMGRVVDIVPNHMAISPLNRWWWDVLENGRSSRYAHYFDVDWHAAAVDRILLPVLGAPYGQVLQQGELTLTRQRGSFVARYYEHAAPLDPASLGGLLDRAARRAGSDELGFLADAFASLPPPEEARRRHRNKEVLRRLFERLLDEEPEVAAAVDAELAAVAADPGRLHALLELQNHRFAHWRIGRQELDYRRFFDIDHLVGLRVEDEEVFADTHALILEQVRRGEVQGLRIDHPDGLRDPEGYLRHLRAAAPSAWIVVEKILEPGEPLRDSWPIEGTTGYDFANLVTGLFVDAAGESALTSLYAAFTGESGEYEAVVHDKKRLVMREGLGSELNRLTELFVDVCNRHPSHRDHSRRDLAMALRAVIARFSVYRTYVMPGRVDDLDRQVIEEAVAAAAEDLPEVEPSLLDFLRRVLLLEVDGDGERSFALSFQQVTGPVMAKGVEDTAFYVYNRLVALNEVGGDPGRFGVAPEAFHAEMADARHPATLRALSTHDTKRSEDVRARIALLSEIPEAWGQAVRRWSLHNEAHRRDDLPDRNLEYLLYQTLVGAWPITADRLCAYLEKATREAKVHTSWARPDPTYEEAVRAFATGILADERFVAMLEELVDTLRPQGRVVSLAQVLLQCTVPGVPDRYQGAELWDLSLVDPDNRRPVDWDLRRRALAELEGIAPAELEARLRDPSDPGLPKLYVLREALAARRRLEERAPYVPLVAEGARAEHVVAFRRGDALITVAPRLVMRLEAAGPDPWGDTRLELPPGRFFDRINGRTVQGSVALAELLSPLPVALLEREEASGA